MRCAWFLPVLFLLGGCASSDSQSERRANEERTAGGTFFGGLAEGLFTGLSGEDSQQYRNRTDMDQFESKSY